ncbi:MAG: hypothetical protein VXW08_07320, partial [Candidatus Thermoplasmatota archaeon]|nr:hypothetical protein [Candidatus Thermoplasmatota archaeon]
MAWGLYQPTQRYLVDFGNANGHIDPENELNGAYHSGGYLGTDIDTSYTYQHNQTFFVENIGLDEVVTDVGCSFRTTVRGAGVHTQSLTLLDSSGGTVWSLSEDECESSVIRLQTGESYRLEFISTSTAIDSSVEIILSYTLSAYQPLILGDNGNAILRSDTDLAITELQT